MAEGKFKKKIKTDEGSTVYVYSERQVQHRHNEKAKRLLKLQDQIGKIRDQVTKDLKSKDAKTQQVALAVGLIDHTYERVGNDDSADNGHFGVTGWEKQHCKFSGNSATLSYVGKSGVKHTKKVTEAKLVSALKKALEGKKDTDQILDQVQAEDVNQYLKPFKVTAKDLRGFHANREMREALKRARKGKLPEDKKEREKALKGEWKKALEETAEAVGHEPATLDGQYLVPGLKDQYLKDGSIQPPGAVKKASVDRVATRWLLATSGQDDSNNRYLPHGSTLSDDLLKEIHKEQLGTLGDYQVWLVNGEVVRNKVDMDFLMGGNPGAYQYCPEGELWLEFNESAGDFAAILAHEFVECWLMQHNGLTYERAHAVAERIEHHVRDTVVKQPEPNDSHSLKDIQKKAVPLIQAALAILDRTLPKQ